MLYLVIWAVLLGVALVAWAIDAHGHRAQVRRLSQRLEEAESVGMHLREAMTEIVQAVDSDALRYVDDDEELIAAAVESVTDLRDLDAEDDD